MHDLSEEAIIESAISSDEDIDFSISVLMPAISSYSSSIQAAHQRFQEKRNEKHDFERLN